jgi:predicted phosphohydrolase
MVRTAQNAGIFQRARFHTGYSAQQLSSLREVAVRYRGWFYEETGAKRFLRELIRLEASLKAAGDREKICFLHYPPLYQGYTCQEIIELLERYGVSLCCYGHLHGYSCRLAIEGIHGKVEYRLVSADYLNFRPQKICD